MTTKTQLIAFIIASCFALPTLADQAAYVTKANADRAIELLKNTQTVKSYCAPCSDVVAKSIAVTNVTSADANFQGFWEVSINGQGEDLAYLYFLDKGKWRNVAIALGIPVEEVPEFIE